VVVLLLLALAVAPLRALIDQREHLSQLEQQAEVLEARNALLEERIDRFTDPAYLEQLARGCLGMVRPGETAFVMVPVRGAPATPRC
jgi:cell division protein FtsB